MKAPLAPKPGGGSLMIMEAKWRHRTMENSRISRISCPITTAESTAMAIITNIAEPVFLNGTKVTGGKCLVPLANS